MPHYIAPLHNREIYYRNKILFHYRPTCNVMTLQTEIWFSCLCGQSRFDLVPKPEFIFGIEILFEIFCPCSPANTSSNLSSVWFGIIMSINLIINSIHEKIRSLGSARSGTSHWHFQEQIKNLLVFSNSKY